MEECLICKASSGEIDNGASTIYENDQWIIQHGKTPFGIGTLILTPKRHCIHYWELTNDETKEVGELLKLGSTVISEILNPDQVYICLWSHRDWKPGHIQFLLQPVWNSYKKKYSHQGAILQGEMFKEGKYPSQKEIDEFVNTAKKKVEEVHLK